MEVLGYLFEPFKKKIASFVISEVSCYTSFILLSIEFLPARKKGEGDVCVKLRGDQFIKLYECSMYLKFAMPST